MKTTLNSNDPDLVIKDMPLHSSAVVFRLQGTDYKNLRQAKRWQGGDWEMSLTVPGNGRFSMGELGQWFQSLLMKRIENNHMGAVAWKGVIWEMSLVKDGSKRTVSMDGVWNAIKTIYTEPEESLQLETAFFTSAKSIARYGRREFLLYLDHVPLAQAEAAAQTLLAQTSQPMPELVALDTNEAEGIHIQAVGDVFTLNNKYATTTVNGFEDVSVFLTDTVTADAEFLASGRIAANTLEVEKEQRSPTRVWDLLLALAELGDGTNPWRLWVEDGRVNYQPVNPTPTYEWRGKKYGLQTVTGQTRLWDANPGIVRDYTVPSSAPVAESLLLDSRDYLIEEIQMWQGAKRPQPQPQMSKEDDLLQAMDQYQRMMSDYSDDPLHTISR
jgi:hypothetical protein